MNKEKIIILKKIALFLEVEMPIEEVLRKIVETIKNKQVKKSIEYALRRVPNGETLSLSFAQHRNIWDETITSIIWSGELAGSLPEHLLYAASLLEYKLEFNKKLISALLYPLIIFILSSTLILFLLFYIYPKIIPIFSGMHVPLPFTTRVLLKITAIFKQTYIYVLALIVCGFISIYFFKEYVQGIIKKIKEYVIYIPFIGILVKEYVLSLVSRSVGALSATDVGLIQALVITNKATSFQWVSALLEELKNTIEEGKSLSLRMKTIPQLPTIWQDFISIGERTSRLSEMFIKISEVHRNEVQEKVDTYTKLIEPLLMIITGLIVAVIALSIITPMYSLTQYVH